LSVAVTSPVAAQQTYTWLQTRLHAADSIVVVSHEDFGGAVDSLGNFRPGPLLVIKGHPNYPVFIKHRALTTAQRAELSKVLVRLYQDRINITMHCCAPHHTIFLIKGDQTSFINLCLGCRCIDTSADLARLYQFDGRKWSELGKLFDKLGLAYQW
jgi:hypothetical protein